MQRHSIRLFVLALALGMSVWPAGVMAGLNPVKGWVRGGAVNETRTAEPVAAPAKSADRFFKVLEPTISEPGSVQAYAIRVPGRRLTINSVTETTMRTLSPIQGLGEVRPLKPGEKPVPAREEILQALLKQKVVVEKFEGGSLLQMPVGGLINSFYGFRKLSPRSRTRMHSGIDIAARRGTPIRPAADGVVVSAGWRNGYGITITVDHGGGLQTVYAHCSQSLAVPGQRVTRRNIIGFVGNTGVTTGPHLHFEVISGGRTVNPMRFLTR